MLEPAIAAARWMEFAGAGPIFGLPAFRLLCLDGRAAGLTRLTAGAAALAALGTAAVFTLETAGMAGSLRAALAPGVLAEMLTTTDYGLGALVRLAAGAAAAVLALRGGSAGAVATAGGVALASLAWGGHGSMDEGARGAIHLAADLMHLLAAGLWLGALAGFLVLARDYKGEADRLESALRRFSGIGAALTAVLLLSGLVNAWMLVGPEHWRDVPADPYGRLLLVKAGAFFGMLALAAANRFVWTPRLSAHGPPTDLRGLKLTLGLETALGALALAAVAAMGVLAPVGARG